MALAINDAGDVLTDAGGAWKPAVRAVNDSTGESIVLDGGAWRSMPGGGQGGATPAAQSSASTTDMTPQQMYGGSASDMPAPAPATPQTQLGADVNAVGQGLVSGTGAAIAGAGRIAQAGTGPSAARVLAALDLVDEGKNRDAYQKLSDPERQQVGAYRGSRPEDKQAQRDALQQTIADYDKPNALTQAGMAVEGAAPTLFPVDPANEGHQTGAMRMVGSAGPLIAAGALGGPTGLFASAAAIGAQAYDGTYQDAIAHGASHEDADSAAGKAALGQIATMSMPIGKVLPLIPVPLREGFVKTVVNVGQRAGELSAGNTLGAMAQNYVAQQTYDPERSVFKSTGDAGIDGFLAGLVVHGAGAAVGATRAPVATVSDVMKAPDIDGAIAAAGQAAQAPAGGAGESLAETIMNPPGSRPEQAATTPNAPDSTGTGWGDLFASQPADAAGVPAPQSAGAAASRDMAQPGVADISTADMKANRYQAEMGQLLAPPMAGDTLIHVPGSLPTLAEYSGDPLISQAENLIRERNAGAFIGEGKRLTENNIARVKLYDDNTPSRTALDMMRDDRDAQWAADADDLLPKAKPADLTPAWDWVQGQLSNRRIQETDAVRGVLEDFRDRLIDDNGNLKTDPAAVWGIYDNLRNQLATAKNPLNATGAEKYAQSQLIDAKKVTGDVMNTSTDNQFQTALNNYAQRSQAINSGELLEAFRPKLTNPSGAIMGDRFHNFVVGLATLRGNPGIDPAMSISDGTMRSMINIDSDMKRAGLIKLGAAAGSSTNLLGALAETMGLGAAHMAVGAATHGVGNLVLNAAIKAVSGPIQRARLDALAAKHLAPPEGGYRYPEPDEPSASAVSRGPFGGPSGTSGSGTPPAPAPAAPPEPIPSVAPPVAAPVGPATPSVGRTVGAGPGESVAFTPSGAAVPVRYTVRDASDLIASQLADGRTNPKFPAALQPRDRTRAASVQQVNSIANRLQPERLGASASTSEGAPIIGPDGAVESGNGRTMAIMQAYADGGPVADAYRQWVSAQGHDTSRMQNPVLVRERLGDLDMPARARLAADMGASPIAAMSAPERAAADARAIPADILSMYQGGDVTLAKNAPFARAFAEHVIPPGEQAGFMTADGEMSADGAIRMRNALTQHAYGSNSLVTSLAENADPDIKMFGGALTDAAGDMAKLRGAIDSGAVSKASDIAPHIVAAAQLIQTARRQRISLADAVGQRDAFSVLPEMTEDILQAAFGDSYAGRMSRARMADLLSSFAQEAQMQSGLFGANLTAGEMLAEARAKYGYGTKAGVKSGSGVSVGNGPGIDFNRP
jgi:hypothetical protein